MKKNKNKEIVSEMFEDTRQDYKWLNREKKKTEIVNLSIIVFCLIVISYFVIGLGVKLFIL